MRSRNAALNKDRRDGILAAAGRCFVRDGFDATSMKSICREAGMSPGTVYHYFASKAEIVVGIIERESSMAAELIATVDKNAHVIAGLFSVIDRIEADLTDDELVLHAEIGAVLLRDPQLREQARLAEEDMIARLAARLDHAKAAGLIDDRLDALTMAILIGALIDGLIWRASLHGRPAFLASLPSVKQAIGRMLTGSDLNGIA